MLYRTAIGILWKQVTAMGVKGILKAIQSSASILPGSYVNNDMLGK